MRLQRVCLLASIILASSGCGNGGDGQSDSGGIEVDAASGVDSGNVGVDGGNVGVDGGNGTDAGTGAPSPALLPVATTSHFPLVGAYDDLNVPSLAAGEAYVDPTTGVTIYKLTSGFFPTATANWGHDYSEGGDEVSLPHDGETRTVLVRQNGGGYWLVDFSPGVGVANARQLTGNLAPASDVCFTFSNNPATPHYAYVIGGGAVRRFDIRSLTEVPGSGWPVMDSAALYWLHQAESDSLFTWMRPSAGTVVGYEPSSATLKTHVDANINEPRIDRAGRYIGLAMNTPANGLRVWDWENDVISWFTAGYPDHPQFAHNASLRRRWLGIDVDQSYPPEYTMFISDVPDSAQHIGGPANATLYYGNGSWIQHPADLNDQWALFSNYGELAPGTYEWLAPGGMIFITPNGERRLLGHPYNTSDTYSFYSFCKLSSDGRYVLFTSDMNGSSRSDVFLAEVPVN